MKLNEILGKPGEGIHFHVFGIAIMDVIGTLTVGALIGHYLLNAWWQGIILFFLLGQLLHLILGVDTAFVKLLGLSRK